MTQTEQDSGKTYADMWGEAVHSIRHLRVLSMGLAGLILLLVGSVNLAEASWVLGRVGPGLRGHEAHVTAFHSANARVRSTR